MRIAHTPSYSVESHVDAQSVADLYKRAGLNRPVADLRRMQKMLDNSDLILCAWSDERLVGIARAITDYHYCCYLSDLAVDPKFQKMGIGKQLIQKIMDIVGEETKLILLAAPTAVDFYAHIGLIRDENAWVIPRKR